MPITTTPKPESRPATTATEKAFRISADAIVGPTVVIGEMSIPAIAATMPDKPYESMIVCVAEIPISSAASRSAATASNALPNKVLRLNSSITPITANTPMATEISSGVMLMPKKCNESEEIGEGKGRSSRPQMFSAAEKPSKPKIMVSSIQPSLFCSSDKRTQARSTTSPIATPNNNPPGTINQYGTPRSSTVSYTHL